MIKSLLVLNLDEDESQIASRIEDINILLRNHKNLVVSDCDEELLVLVEFMSDIELNSITFFAPCNNEEKKDDEEDITMSPLKLVQLYKTNSIDINFDDVKSLKSDKTVKCSLKKLPKGHTVKLRTRSKCAMTFKKIKHLVIYIQNNQFGTEKTYVSNIRLNINSSINGFGENIYLWTEDTNERHIAKFTIENLKDILFGKQPTMDDICCNLSDCASLAYLTAALKVYHKYVLRNTKIMDNGDEEKKDIEGNGLEQCKIIDILNNFHHLLSEHDYQFEDIYNLLVQRSNNNEYCDMSQCYLTRRNNRNRMDQNNRKVRYFNCDTTTDIIKEQILDRIHCYGFHSFDVGHKLTRKSMQEVLEKVDSGINDIIRQKAPQKDVNNKFNTGNSYSFGYRFFYWPWYKENDGVFDPTQTASQLLSNRYHVANEKYIIKDWYIKPKYSCIKDEVIWNPICKISINGWNQTAAKASRHLTTTFARAIKSYESDKTKSFTDSGLAYQAILAKYKIKEGVPITEKHITAMMLYCNFDGLSYSFSATFRRSSDEETDHKFKERHSNYAHWAKLLREMECFETGEKCDGRVPLYHGIHGDVTFDSVAARIHGPLSTTTSYSVAVQFCDHNGVILEFAISQWQAPSAYFACEWLSDHSAEQERFLIGGTGVLRFTTVIRCPSGGVAYNYQLYVNALNAISDVAGNVCDNHSTIDIGKLDDVSEEDKFTKRMMCRMIAHELHRHYPNDYPAFKSLPKYIEKLIHSHFQNIKFSVLSKSCIRGKRGVFGYFFFYNNGWIKLNLYTKVFPSLRRLKITWEGFTMLSTELFELILGYFKKNPNTTLEWIHLCRCDEKKLKIKEAISIHTQEFEKQGWKLYAMDTNGIIIASMTKNMDSLHPPKNAVHTITYSDPHKKIGTINTRELFGK